MEGYVFSWETKTCWGVTWRAPDEEHENPWLPEWITSGWPEDTVIAPDRPPQGTDMTKTWKANYLPDKTMEWILVDAPGLGETGPLSIAVPVEEGLEDGAA